MPNNSFSVKLTCLVQYICGNKKIKERQHTLTLSVEGKLLYSSLSQVLQGEVGGDWPCVSVAAEPPVASAGSVTPHSFEHGVEVGFELTSLFKDFCFVSGCSYSLGHCVVGICFFR